MSDPDRVTKGRPRLRCAAVVGWLVGTALVAATPVLADDSIVTYKSISPDLAFKIAQAALKRCRDDGSQVAVVVMDRFGQTLVLLRDRYAGLPAPTTASSKAYTSLSFKLSTSAFVQAIAAKQLSPELGRLPNIVMMAGGLPIEAAGALVGAVGVSGAPGGDKDEACAQAGLDSVQDKLDF